jgi:DNA-binding NtrC family response regulator
MFSDEISAPLVAVIDGEPAIIALLEETLELEGLRVVGLSLTASADPEATVTSFLQEHLPRLVLLDIPPPYGGAWSLVQATRRAVPDAAVVLITTNPDDVAALASKDDAVQILGKPFELDELLRVARASTATARSTERTTS